MSTRWPEEVDVDDVILDAAERCFTQASVAATTVEDIANAAGVSRITVYRRIGNRDQLVLLVLLRVTDRFLASLRPRLITAPDLGAALAMLVDATVRGVRSDDLRLLFASAEHGALGAPIPGALAPMAERFGGIISMLSDQFPSQLLDHVRTDEAGEWLLRVIVSLVTLEREARPNAGERDRWLRTFVLPGLVVAGAKKSSG